MYKKGYYSRLKPNVFDVLINVEVYPVNEVVKY